LSKNYYEILGVDRDAESVAIKKAYRALSMEHHPDKGGDEEKFKEISEAYSTLSNPEKRAEYDNPMRQQMPHGADPFDMFMRGRHPFSNRRPSPNSPRRGKNLMVDQEIPMRFFIIGGKIKVSFKFMNFCTECGGTGAEEKSKCSVCNGAGQIMEGRQAQGIFIQSSRTCPTCNGRGFRIDKECGGCSGRGQIEDERKAELDVPMGIRDGQVIGAAGLGASGANGGPAGDLTVRLHMKYPKAEELTEEQRKILEEL
jgi:molecular chaperone DnaJ